MKSWCLFYTSPKDGKRARTTIGRYPQTGLADARTRAREAHTSLDEGLDPRDVATATMTVRQLDRIFDQQRSPYSSAVLRSPMSLTYHSRPSWACRRCSPAG